VILFILIILFSYIMSKFLLISIVHGIMIKI